MNLLDDHNLIMQEIVRNSFNGPDPLKTPLHLRAASNGNLFNHQSMLNSESDDDCNSESEDFNIHFNQKPDQDFGLGYWMKHTNHQRYESNLPHYSKSPKNVAFIPKPVTHNTTSNKKKSKPDNICKDKPVKPKKTKHHTKTKDQKIPKEQKSASSKYNSTKSNYNIPRLKIPKDVVKKYLKTLSPMSSSSSSSSESESPHNQKFKHNFEASESISKHTKQSKSNLYLSDTPLSNHNDSSCLQTSFLSSNYSKPQSVYLLSVASHDNMLLSMTIDKNLYFDISSLPVINGDSSVPSKITDSHQLELVEHDSSDNSDKCEFQIDHNDAVLTNDDIYDTDHRNEVLLEEDPTSLSTNCDSHQIENGAKAISPDSNDLNVFNHLTSAGSRKRLFDQESANENETGVVSKKKMLEMNNNNFSPEPEKSPSRMTVLDYVKFLTQKMKNFEEKMHEKYCLSQPNAMKFLSQNHAFNWESYKSDSSQLHLVPCEFIAEIFHRALHCFGLEKRILKETQNVDSSPGHRMDSTHSTEYKKIRDEYSFSLKRVRYGIVVIDDLFKRKINFQSTQPNNDVTVVRKWKHLIYYLCLQAKAVFMTKEMQYHNHATQVAQSNSFDGDCNMPFNTTPTARYSSALPADSHSKHQLPKESSRTFDSKFMKTTPEHLCQFDMDVSPHSYDSGKGSSIRLSSNGNSQVSGCQTTSSLNSTPHSWNETQFSLPGFHMYRIDEYLKTANEFIQFLPETLHLHNEIISKVGFEPNANSSDNMMRFINYTEVCQQICKQDAMSECLQRLLSQAVRL